MALRLTSNRSARRPTSSPCSSTASRTRVLRHEQLGRELVGLALLTLPGGVDGAAALGRQALRVQHEVADLVGDGEPAAVLAGRAAQHDRVAVADGLERGLADERLAGGLDDLEVERAHDVTQRDGLACDAGASAAGARPAGGCRRKSGSPGCLAANTTTASGRTPRDAVPAPGSRSRRPPARAQPIRRQQARDDAAHQQRDPDGAGADDAPCAASPARAPARRSSPRRGCRARSRSRR